MKRSTAVLLASVLALGGCSRIAALNPFSPKPFVQTDTLSSEEWAKLKRADAARLHGQGIPGAPTTQPIEEPALDQFVGFIKFAFYRFPKGLYDYYQGRTPGRYARMMEDDQSPDNRRTGVVMLAANYEFARKEPYTRRYWQIAQGDSDYLVKSAAVRALNRSRDASVNPIAIRLLDDSNVLLRLEAAKALANLPDEKAIPGLLKHLAGDIEVKGEGNRPEPQRENRDVRVACADALRNYHNRDVTRALIDVLGEKDFEVAWQARKSLILMTGRDFRYDQSKWKDYMLKAANPFG